MRKFIMAKARTTHFNIEKNQKGQKYLTKDDTKMPMCLNIPWNSPDHIDT